MRVKPKISKTDGKWQVTKPHFGFRPAAEVVSHHSWRDAVGSLVQIAEHYAPGGSAERGRDRADSIATVPRWTPFESPYEDARRPL